MLVPLFLLCVGSLLEGIEGDEHEEAHAVHMRLVKVNCSWGNIEIDNPKVELILIGVLGALGLFVLIGVFILSILIIRSNPAKGENIEL